MKSGANENDESDGELFDLDEASSPALLVSFRGVRLTIDRRRLVELLEREQVLLGAKKSGLTGVAPDVASPAGQGISHASLSTRVKKIHAVASQTKRLRRAYIDMLLDLMENFDWRIPSHPNTRLDIHLTQISSWGSATPELKRKIAAFLDRYQRERAHG